MYTYTSEWLQVHSVNCVWSLILLYFLVQIINNFLCVLICNFDLKFCLTCNFVQITPKLLTVKHCLSFVQDIVTFEGSAEVTIIATSESLLYVWQNHALCGTHQSKLYHWFGDRETWEPVTRWHWVVLPLCSSAGCLFSHVTLSSATIV